MFVGFPTNTPPPGWVRIFLYAPRWDFHPLLLDRALHTYRLCKTISRSPILSENAPVGRSPASRTAPIATGQAPFDASGDTRLGYWLGGKSSLRSQSGIPSCLAGKMYPLHSPPFFSLFFSSLSFFFFLVLFCLF